MLLLLLACTSPADPTPGSPKTDDTAAVDTGDSDPGETADSGGDSDTGLNFDPDGDGLVEVCFRGVPPEESEPRWMWQDWPAATWWYFSLENADGVECYPNDANMVLYDGTCVRFGYTCTLTGSDLWPVVRDEELLARCEGIF